MESDRSRHAERIKFPMGVHAGADEERQVGVSSTAMMAQRETSYASWRFNCIRLAGNTCAVSRRLRNQSTL